MAKQPARVTKEAWFIDKPNDPFAINPQWSKIQLIFDSIHDRNFKNYRDENIAAWADLGTIKAHLFNLLSPGQIEKLFQFELARDNMKNHE